MTPQTIFITGNAGSGKTTFAQKLADKTGLPLFGLDSIVWGPKWTKPSRDVINVRIHTLTVQPAWIIEGVSSLVERAADTVVFLDVSPAVCTWNCVKRNRRYLFRSRTGMPVNCPEILIIPALLKIIWRFNSDVRPDILDRMAKANSVQKYYRVNGSPALQDLLEI